MGLDDKPRQLAVAVFCGAKNGKNPEFMKAAKFLATALHSQTWSLVYGAGTSGIMGEVARNLVALSGPESVHGIIPEALLPIERARTLSTSNNRHDAYGRLTVVQDMHTRKAMMAQEAEAFVALPGGFGTMEELMEIITWNYLGIHDKPIVLFNVDGYYDDLMKWVVNAVEEEFVDRGNKDIVVEAKTADEVIERIKGYKTATQRRQLDWQIR